MRIALRVGLEVLGQGLGRVASEALDAVRDDVHLARVGDPPPPDVLLGRVVVAGEGEGGVDGARVLGDAIRGLRPETRKSVPAPRSASVIPSRSSYPAATAISAPGRSGAHARSRATSRCSMPRSASRAARRPPSSPVQPVTAIGGSAMMAGV